MSRFPTRPPLPLFSVRVDLAAVVGPAAFIGFTASTSKSPASQDVLAWSVNGQPIGLTAQSQTGGVIANSILDFSQVQGANGWFYGYYRDPFTPSTFTELPHFGVYTLPNGIKSRPTWYEGRKFWTELWAAGGHPNSVVTSVTARPVNQWAVRRWVSPVDAQVEVAGFLSKSDVTGGDGVLGKIYLNGTELWSRSIAAKDATGVNYDLSFQVHRGDRIDFVLEPKKTDFYDSSYLAAVISRNPG